LSKYKWWILGGLALLLSAAAAFMLRKPSTAGAGPSSTQSHSDVFAAAAPYQPAGASASKNNALLNALKEELFDVESDKISGTISPAEYAEVKAALEIVLKRALKKS
jgi:hypothetical protein